MLCSKCLIESNHKIVKNCKQIDAEQMFQQVKDVREQLIEKREQITQALLKLDKIVMIEDEECEEEPVSIPQSDFVQLMKSVDEMLGTNKKSEESKDQEEEEG